MRKLIKVQEKHIMSGLPRESDSCPIALAVKEQTGFNGVAVGNDKIYCYNHSQLLPRSAKRFVNRFDKLKEVKPFNFILKG